MRAARRLRTLVARCGVDIDHFEYEDMFHGWLLQLSLPEARHATAQIIDLLWS